MYLCYYNVVGRIRYKKRGKDVQSTIANVVASKVVKGAECMEVEDIKKLRDLFIA